MHQLHNKANVLFLQGLEDAMRRLQRSNPDHRRLAAIQLPAMPVVCSSLDTADKAASDTQSAGNTTDDSGINPGGGVWVKRGADTGAGGGKGNGSAAESVEG